MANEININVKATDNATASMAKISSAGESMAVKIGSSVGKVANVIGGEVGELVGKVGEGFDKIGESSSTGWGKIAAGGAVVAGVGVALQSFASKGQQAEAQLKVAVDNTGDSFDDYEGKISKAESAGAKFGDTNTQVAGALQTLVQATGSTDTALSDLNVTYNLAAAKHISLADAAGLVAKVYSGSSKTLRQFGVDMTVTAGDTQEATAALGALNQKISGQGAASVDNFGGKVAQAKAEVTDWADKVASFAGGPLTYLSTAVSIGSGVVDIWSAHSERAAAKQLQLAAATAAEAEAAVAGAAANGEAAAATVALEASMGPVGWTLAAIGTAAAAAGIAYVGMSHGASQDAQEVKNLTQALEQSKGAVDDTVKSSLAKSLTDSGAIKNAKTLGVSTDDLTSAVLGNADAQKRVQTAVNAATNTYVKALGTTQGATKSQSDAADAANNLGTEIKSLSKALEEGKITASQYQTAVAGLGATVTPTVTAFDDLSTQLAAASVAQTKTATDTRMAYLAMVNEGNQAGLLKLALDGLNGSVLSVDEAQTNLWDATNQNTVALKENRTKVIDGSTASIAAQKAIQGQENAIQAVMNANIAAGVPTQKATDLANQQGQAFLQQIAKTDGAKSAVYAYAQQILGIPAAAQTTMTVNDAAALATIASYKAQVAALNSGVRIGMQAPEAGSGLSYAHGGIIGAATGGPRGGMHWVGEHGPELVRLPSGSSVSSNPDSMRIASQGGGVPQINITLAPGGGITELERALLQWLRQTIRVTGGGNVQKALGGG